MGSRDDHLHRAYHENAIAFHRKTNVNKQQSLLPGQDALGDREHLLHASVYVQVHHITPPATVFIQ